MLDEKRIKSYESRCIDSETQINNAWNELLVALTDNAYDLEPAQYTRLIKLTNKLYKALMLHEYQTHKLKEIYTHNNRQSAEPFASSSEEIESFYNAHHSELLHKLNTESNR
jgi:hypothetical protein